MTCEVSHGAVANHILLGRGRGRWGRWGRRGGGQVNGAVVLGELPCCPALPPLPRSSRRSTQIAHVDNGSATCCNQTRNTVVPGLVLCMG